MNELKSNLNESCQSNFQTLLKTNCEFVYSLKQFENDCLQPLLNETNIWKKEATKFVNVRNQWIVSSWFGKSEFQTTIERQLLQNLIRNILTDDLLYVLVENACSKVGIEWSLISHQERFNIVDACIALCIDIYIAKRCKFEVLTVSNNSQNCNPRQTLTFVDNKVVQIDPEYPLFKDVFEFRSILVNKASIATTTNRETLFSRQQSEQQSGRQSNRYQTIKNTDHTNYTDVNNSPVVVIDQEDNSNNSNNSNHSNINNPNNTNIHHLSDSNKDNPNNTNINHLFDSNMNEPNNPNMNEPNKAIMNDLQNHENSSDSVLVKTQTNQVQTRSKSKRKQTFSNNQNINWLNATRSLNVLDLSLIRLLQTQNVFTKQQQECVDNLLTDSSFDSINQRIIKQLGVKSSTMSNTFLLKWNAKPWAQQKKDLKECFLSLI